MKNVQVLIPRTSGNVIFHGKRDFVEVIKVRILKSDYPELSGEPTAIIRTLIRGSHERQTQGRCDD